jgi:hypothetical protein
VQTHILGKGERKKERKKERPKNPHEKRNPRPKIHPSIHRHPHIHPFFKEMLALSSKDNVFGGVEEKGGRKVGL